MRGGSVSRLQKPDPNNHPPVVRAGECYTLEEAAKRMRWKKHSTRQALRAGLVTTKFGSRRYVTGEAILNLMQKLAEQQAVEGEQ